MSRRSVFLATALLAAAPAFAQTSHSAHEHKSDAKPAAQADAMSVGEIRKVDKDAGKVTIKHGPLASLDMPAMTMVFRVKDLAMLDNLKAGDNIRFRAEKIDGNYTVTEYQAAK
jgi:Cu(I)/Ag(I) efflux system periplasmic protein CusF